jgi:hypothetical protein
LEKSANIVITVLVVLAIAAGIVITLLTLLGGPEWMKLMILPALFIATLIGSYWFLLAPQPSLRTAKKTYGSRGVGFTSNGCEGFLDASRDLGGELASYSHHPFLSPAFSPE